jgi:fatty acid-binding protein DegV
MEDPSILEEAKAICLERGFKEVNICQASPTNAYHAGPNVLGIHFYFDGPHPVTAYQN